MTTTERTITGSDRDATTSFGILPTEPAPIEQPPFDGYKDIHLGIRKGLFGVTMDAGRADPGDRCARETLAEDVRTLVALLAKHAFHEDEFLRPVISAHFPTMSDTLDAEHAVLEARMETLVELADGAAGAPGAEQRGRMRGLYLDLAAFTSAYLAHQDFEERRVMPALATVVSPETLIGINGEIVASIPPDEMGFSLSLMLPAMNIEDRVELLEGMRASAPPEVFAGVWALAGSVLAPADHEALGRRLGVV
jgi:hypothetical protein